MELKTGPTKPTGSNVAPPVAPKPAADPAPKPAVGVSAKTSVPLFGGNRGGRPRKDGLTPGSPEAAKVDKKNDRDRKREERAEAARLAEPAPLPSAIEGQSGPQLPSAPNGNIAPGPQAGPENIAIPWDPTVLRPFFEELIDATEEGRVNRLREMAIKAALPDPVVREIASDAKYSPVCKRSMALTAPNVTAKALNRIGISGKYSDEAILAMALIGNFVQGRRLQGKLQKLIEQANKAQKKNENDPAKKAN